ncbi:MAG TPA: response regulator [Myxococcaceae bacterium]|nr:response regulator [Myxococcaceae bacterium]
MKKLILVVDDQPENLKLVRRYLEAKGYRVASALNTREADALMERERPALVVVDLSMPGEDGLTWVNRLRHDGESQLPFVALTAHASPEVVDQARAVGCEDIITKPVPLHSLLGIVESRIGEAQ